MKNKLLAGVFCLLTICTIIIGAVSVTAESKANTVGEAQSLVDDIVDFKLKQSGADSIQDWINDSLSGNAGATSEWYILALSQSGSYDFSAYQATLKNYLANNEVYSASSRQKYALALISTGSTDSYITEVLENSIGQQGVMSWVYGLHLLNNGYTSTSYAIESVKQTLLSLQLGDGGWAISGAAGDVDVTAMAVQALAPHYNSDSSVRAAIDKALSLLSSRQLAEGDYSSYGVPNPESTAQVITTLSVLGIDCESDGRFIKNGNTLFDGLKKYQLSDGSFCHTLSGDFNENATAQSFYSMVAYIRMMQGKGSLYILDHRNPTGLPKVETPTMAPVEPVTQPVTEANNTPDSTVSAEPTTADKESGNSVISETSENGETVAESDTLETTSEDKTNTQETESSSNDTTDQSDKTTEDNSTETTENTDNENDDKEAETALSGEASDNEAKTAGYKLWVSLGIAGLALAACAILFIANKRNKKNFIMVALIAALAIGFIILTDFKSTDDYYSGEDIFKENAVGTVTLTIRCDTVIGKSDSEYIPEDGIVLETTEFVIDEDDTVYDILTEAAKKYSIHVENTGTNGMVYIAGINYLYEFDFGDLSGWMYFVNGEEASVGCEEYVLSDGDTIEWCYSCELGNDLK